MAASTLVAIPVVIFFVMVQGRQHDQRPSERGGKRLMQQILLPGFSGAELPSWVAARLRFGTSGICLYGDNIESKEQLKALCTAIREANPRAIIAIDEEGGDVTRLFYKEGSPYPGNAIPQADLMTLR